MCGRDRQQVEWAAARCGRGGSFRAGGGGQRCGHRHRQRGSPVGDAGGQRALISALRARVAQQQQVVNAYKARDARLAAVLRSLAYSQGRGGGGGTPMRGMPFGGGGFGRGGGGGSPLSGLAGAGSPLASLVGRFNPTTSAWAGGMTPPGRIAGTPLGALILDSSP